MLYTIGHGALALDDLLRRLHAHGVRMVLDVRSHPHSRRAPQYNRPELEAELASGGVAYRWLGEHLGGKPLVPDGPTPIEQAHMLSAGVTEASALARGAIGALLCAELDPNRCHRSTTLAGCFEQEGFAVVHILGDGTAEPHQPALDL